MDKQRKRKNNMGKVEDRNETGRKEGGEREVEVRREAQGRRKGDDKKGKGGSEGSLLNITQCYPLLSALKQLYSECHVLFSKRLYLCGQRVCAHECVCQPRHFCQYLCQNLPAQACVCAYVCSHMRAHRRRKALWMNHPSSVVRLLQLVVEAPEVEPAHLSYFQTSEGL